VAEDSAATTSRQQAMAAALETLQRHLYNINDSADAHLSLLTGLIERRSIIVCQIPCNSAEIRKFRGKWQISWLGSKFRGLRKSVVSSPSSSSSAGKCRFFSF